MSVFSVSAVDTRGVVYSLPVESVSIVAGFDWLSAIVIRLAEDTALKGDVAITLTLRGVTSNTVMIGIKSP